MRVFLAFLAGVFVSSLAVAATTVVCDIRTLAQATTCMEKVAKTRPDYEEPNDGLATKDVKRLALVMKLIGRDSKTLRRARQADFAGLMIEHSDEHHLYYFAMKKGKKVRPVELYDLNVVDLTVSLEKPYSKTALNPQTYFLGLGKKGSCAYDDVKEQLNELEESDE